MEEEHEFSRFCPVAKPENRAAPVRKQLDVPPQPRVKVGVVGYDGSSDSFGQPGDVYSPGGREEKLDLCRGEEVHKGPDQCAVDIGKWLQAT